jgi:uncharacterized protein
MSRDFPDWIDVQRSAQAGRRFAGRARLEWMPRVLDLLDSPETDDTIAFEVSAQRDEQGAARLRVQVTGEVPMMCQRTLRRYAQHIDSESEVAVVASEREIDELPEELEPKLVADGRLRLIELVEDELLLALPLVPRDPASEPVDAAAGVEHGGSAAGAAASDDAGPFAELKRLRRDRD